MEFLHKYMEFFSFPLDEPKKTEYNDSQRRENMNEENICKFAPTKEADQRLNIMNLVYEKNANFTKFKIPASYSLHIVAQGTGLLRTPNCDYPIQKGDLVFSLPGKPYYVQNESDLQYIYTTFLGVRALILMDRISVHGDVPIYHGYEGLIPLWEDAVQEANENNIDLAAEGILLFTLSKLCISQTEGVNVSGNQDKILLIKQYIDEHYNDGDLSLQTISQRFSYNFKYLSNAFRKTVGIGFNQYLNDLRLNNAKRLMDNGFVSIKEIVQLSGYQDALYFSKVFRARFGESPRDYLKKSKESKTNE